MPNDEGAIEFEVRDLPFPLTPEEVGLKGEDLARSLHAKQQLAEERSSVMGGFKERGGEIEKEIGRLSEIVRSRREYRPVRCEWSADDEKARMHLVRTDTGEIVTSRPMDEHEAQRALFEAREGGKGKKKKAAGDEAPVA
jgi:hypothetical protein